MSNEYVTNPKDSPLADAVKRRNYKRVKQILESEENPDVNQLVIDDDKSTTLLGIALSIGNTEMLELLLENGADPNANTIYKDPPSYPKLNAFQMAEVDGRRFYFEALVNRTCGHKTGRTKQDPDGHKFEEKYNQETSASVAQRG